jgi:hypothetical protein
MNRLVPCTPSSTSGGWRGRKGLTMPAAENDQNAFSPASYSGARPGPGQPSGYGAATFAPGGGGCGGLFERITVNLTSRASRALELATELTGDTRTDTVNRALQIYAYVEQVMASGGSIRVRAAAGVELDLLKYL